MIEIVSKLTTQIIVRINRSSERAVAGKKMRKRRQEFVVAQQLVGIRFAPRAIGVWRRKVIEFLSTILTGRGDHRLVIKLFGDRTIGPVLLRKNAIGARE